ncbi:MAG: helix-hairpin-helix domain-containing protein, partial [Chloroflexi bacterium]|nr:helix-hairpin-helix domain-containing protein [Chloroflexota bacterium]
MVNKCLLLFDGNALIHRAYHAMPPLVLKKTGEDVGAIYGFMSMFLKTVAGYLPQYIVFAFDKKGPTFRHDMYQDYKANRPKAPDDLVGQIIRARQLIAGSGIAYYEADGFEADDIIGTITVAASQKGIKTFIVTGDADAMQLVNENVSVLYPAKGNSFAELKEFTPAEVKEKYGVYPQNIADLKALSGDSSDNIPGVSGIGPKTAIALIEKFGSVEEICRQASQIESARVREIIKQNCLNATFYKTLCLIRCDAPIDIDFIAMQSNKVQSQKLSDDFTTLEFNSLLPRLNALMQIYGYVAKEDRNSPNLNVSAGQYMLVQTLPQLQSLTEALKDVDYFALDTETDGIDALQASLVGLSLSLRSCQSFYVHLPKSTPKEGSQVSMFDFQTPAVGIDGLTLEQIQKSLNPILQKAKIYAHNAKFDMHALKHNGFSVPKCVFDTMLAAYLIGEVNLGLKSLVLSRLGHQMKPIKDLIGSGKNARTMA